MMVMTRWVTAGSAGSGECIDEYDGVPIGLERPKVVLFVRVVGVAKVVEYRDGFDDPLDRLGAEGRNPGRHDCDAGREVLAQFIVQRANARTRRIGIR
jgi:hypothetical protein